MAGMFQGYQNPADAAAEADIAQRLQQAALLRQRATAMPGEVGGVSVTPNAIGLGARALSAILGKRQQDQALQDVQKYGEQRYNRLMPVMQKMQQARSSEELRQTAAAALQAGDMETYKSAMTAAGQMHQQEQATLQHHLSQARANAADERRMAQDKTQFEQRMALDKAQAEAAIQAADARAARTAAMGGGGGGNSMTSEVANINYILRGTDEAGNVVDPARPGETQEQAQARRQQQLLTVRRGPQFYQSGESPVMLPQAPGGAAMPVAGADGTLAPPAAQYDRNNKQALSAAGTLGKEAGSAEARALTAEAQQPQLEESVNQLGELADTASFTKMDQAYNWLRRQASLDATQGSVDREKYMSIVDNQILPILRSTFGAQFTQKEGEWLRETLGSADKSPMEKEAVLRGFIETKRRTLETMKREAALMNGRQALPAASSAAPTAAAPNSDDDLIKKYLQQ